MLKTDGMDKDPISGNDVPLGSTAKEVRDDVDARLSEGEYVLPADVVRYFGLEKIEEMVNVAKEGIEQMDANGRIGGDPVPVEGDELLEQADQFFNAGGMVRNGAGLQGTNRAIDTGAMIDQAKIRATKDPEFAALLKSKGISIEGTDKVTPQVNNMGMPVQMNNGGMVKGYAEGGNVFGQTPYRPADFKSSFNPYAHHLGYSASGTGGYMQSPDSVSADPSKMCGPGTVWDEEKKMCVPVGLQQTRNDDDGGGPAMPQGDPNAWMKKFDYSNPETLYEQTMSTLSVEEDGEEKGGLLGALGGLLEGGILGKFTATTSAAQAMANARVLRAQGREDLADKIEAQYSTFVEEKGISMIPEAWRDGDRLAEDIMEVHGTTITEWGSKGGAATGPAGTGLMAKASKEAIAGAADMHKAIKDKGKTVAPLKNNDDDDGPSHAEIMASHNAIREAKARTEARSNVADVSRKAKESGKSIAEVGREMAPSSEREKEEEGGGRSGGWNKGGLVQRRKKK